MNLAREAAIARSEALVVSCDTIGLTKTCVETLREFYPDLRLILVDNGSTDGSREWIEQLAKDELCRCILLKENTTHGPGLHRGMEMAVGDFILILDSDTETLKGGFIEPMVHLFLSAPNVFAVGPVGTGDITGTRPGDYPIVHPCRMMLNRERYFLGRAFCHAGQPIHLAMRDARDRKDLLLHFPLNEYIKHYGGGTRSVVGRRIQEARRRRTE